MVRFDRSLNSVVLLFECFMVYELHMLLSASAHIDTIIGSKQKGNPKPLMDLFYLQL